MKCVEEWRKIKGYDNYLISNLGRVKSLKREEKLGNNVFIREEKIMRLKKHRDGYLCISLSKNGEPKMFQVHRLVAKEFIPNPENKPQVNHINAIRYDNNVENLEWCTNSENQIHCRRVTGYVESEETRKKRSINTTRRNIENHATAIPINVNGMWFKNLKEASLFHGKHKGYFAELIKRRRTNENSCPQWDIKL